MPDDTTDPVATRGAALLHAQCWLWGQDLRGSHGDLLRAAGLARHRRPEARSHRTYYVESLTGGRFVAVWSGGLFLGNSGGTFLFPRLRFAPIHLPDVREPEDLRELSARAGMPPAPAGTPERDAAVCDAVAWLAGYEDRIVALAGAAWRTRCAEVWAETEAQARDLAAGMGVEYEPLPPLPPTGLGDAWRALAGALVTG